MNRKPKIAVAMSGGVDSSVAAYILSNEGYDVVGVNLNLWSCFKASKTKSCCSPDDRIDAMKVSERIGIPFVSVDMRDEFRDKIVMQFVDEYSKGRTPNPCIRCNSIIKFDLLLQWLEKNLDIHEIATGHYARIEKSNQSIHLKKGIDRSKDQTYFLFDIKPETLKRIHFPLGDKTKEFSRQTAKDAGLPVAEKPESQEICFVPDGDIAGFIDDYYPEFSGRKGDFIDSNGNKLGVHRGIHAYTIGQRKKLGIGFGKRKYVTTIRPESREIILGDNDDLMTKNCRVDNISMIEDRGDQFTAEVKVRYKSPAVRAKVKLYNNHTAELKFDKPVRAITPGQAAVFYDGEMVIGGGWIVSACRRSGV